MAHLLQPKRPGLALNMRNSTLSPTAVLYISNALSNSNYYITALSFKYCFLEFDDILCLASGIKFNKTMVKLDLGNNCLKSCVVKFLLEAILDNATLAHLDLSNNFLDNEFAADLAHLLENNPVLHTVDIANYPIEQAGAKYLLSSLLQHNENLTSLGNLEDTNMLMGVRIREELRQTLLLNASSHLRKRTISNQVESTKKQNPTEKNISVFDDPGAKKMDVTLAKTSLEDQLKYPLLKPIAFSNPLQDDYIYSGVWHIKE